MKDDIKCTISFEGQETDITELINLARTDKKKMKQVIKTAVNKAKKQMEKEGR